MALTIKVWKEELSKPGGTLSYVSVIFDVLVVVY
jgi:hypothetical protein